MRFRRLAGSFRALRFGARWRRRLLFASVLAIAFVATALAIAGLGSPPAAPSGLAISNVTFNGMDLSWADNATDETGYDIDRATSPDGPWTTIAAAANTTAYQPRNLVQRTHYYWRVYAKNALGRSGPASADATTLVGPPTAPSDLTAATVSSTQIDLTWTDNSDNETDFVLSRKVGDDGTMAFYKLLPAGTASYSDTGLQPSTKYTYKVQCRNNPSGTFYYSAYSNEAAAATWDTPLAAPTDLQASVPAQSMSIDLSWTDRSGDEQAFEIQRREAPDGTFETIQNFPGDPNSGSTERYSDTAVQGLTAYEYRVRATSTDPHADSTWAGPIQATSYIQPPTGLTATAGDSTVTLSWNPSHGAESYTLYRSGDAPADAKTVTGIAGTTYTDTTVSNGTTYTYSMTATEAGAESGMGEAALSTPMTAPRYCTAYPTSASTIRVYWHAINGYTNYNVYRSTTSSAITTGLLVAKVNNQQGQILHWDDSSLSAKTDYYYQITASNESGETPPSNEDNVSPATGSLPLNHGDAAISQAAQQITGDSDTIVLTPDERVIYADGSSAPNWTLYNPDTDAFSLDYPQTVWGPDFWDDVDHEILGIKPEGAYRKVQTSDFFQTLRNSCSATYYLPSTGSINIGPMRNQMPVNSLCAYNGVVTKGVEIDSGVAFNGASGPYPNRYSPVLRIRDVRQEEGLGDRYVTLQVFHWGDQSGRYLAVDANHMVIANVFCGVDRSSRRLVRFVVGLSRWPVGAAYPDASTSATVLALAPFPTKINSGPSLGEPRAKLVVSLAQNNRTQAYGLFGVLPPIRSWPNGYFDDASYAKNIYVTNEILYDDMNSYYWRSVGSNTTTYLSRPQAWSQETSVNYFYPATNTELYNRYSGR